MEQACDEWDCAQGVGIEFPVSGKWHTLSGASINGGIGAASLLRGHSLCRARMRTQGARCGSVFESLFSKPLGTVRQGYCTCALDCNKNVGKGHELYVYYMSCAVSDALTLKSHNTTHSNQK